METACTVPPRSPRLAGTHGNRSKHSKKGKKLFKRITNSLCRGRFCAKFWFGFLVERREVMGWRGAGRGATRGDKSAIPINLEALSHKKVSGRAPAAGEKGKRCKHAFYVEENKVLSSTWAAETCARALRGRGRSYLCISHQAEQIKTNVRIHSPTHSKMSMKKKIMIFYSPIKRKLLTPGAWASRILQGCFRP